MGSERSQAMAMSVAIGAIIGWILGVAQLIIMNSWEMFYWVGMPMMPIYSAGGWALYGMIIGGGGLFTKSETVVANSEQDARSKQQAA